MTPDTYHTIAAPSEGFFKDKGSKFYAYAFPVYTEEDWQERLAEVKKAHNKARHHCFAWRLGLDGQQYRANDDGEPSGTAGRPILGQIDSFELTNVFVVVVRYFGGTLLGTSGLIQAYRESTAEAFRAADIVSRIVEDVFKIQFDYSLMSPVMQAVKKLDLEMISQDFGVTAYLTIAIRKSEVESSIHSLKAHVLGVREVEVEPGQEVAGLKIEFQYTR
ncbi:MAG: YigZ family protein [Saprospiraceae bacterium]|nr:YigZ family protein [Saprospiraceae bacterium]